MNQDSVNDASTLFNNILIECVKVCIPCKSILAQEDDKPWYDSEIRRNTRKRDRQKRQLKTGNATDWIKYKRIRNKVNNQRKHAKESFNNNLELIITDFENDDKGNFGKLLGILSKTTVHLQLSLLSLLPFFLAKHNGHSLMKQNQTV